MKGVAWKARSPLGLVRWNTVRNNQVLEESYRFRWFVLGIEIIVPCYPALARIILWFDERFGAR